MTSKKDSSTAKLASKMIDFINASPSPFHAVANCIERLRSLGFQELSEREEWSLQQGRQYYVVRNNSSLIAFRIGTCWTNTSAVSIIGAHTDSPCLKVKPVSRQLSSGGYLQVGVETYGGGTWPTWFDRDLSLAGRVFVANGGRHVQKLVHIKRPLLRIPTLAIHLARDQGTKLEFNKEVHLKPLLGLVSSLLDSESEPPSPQSSNSEVSPRNNCYEAIPNLSRRHWPVLIKVVADELGVDPSSIQDFELVLYDTQEATIGGINEELVFAPRLDNLCSTFCALESLCDQSSTSPDTASLIALFDHEEIGSQSSEGADGTFLSSVLQRLSKDKSGLCHEHEVVAKSFIISADMAHAVHPNYASSHENAHQPQINAGPVVKINANMRYATNSPGILMLNNVARDACTPDGDRVPLQLFVVRNDSPCGSTIGPIAASRTGLRTLDLGNPQLSMHSIREMAGVADVGYAVALLSSFHRNYSKIEATIEW